jgi:hypothetical protein
MIDITKPIRFFSPEEQIKYDKWKELKDRSDKMELLKAYTDFLLENGYCDSDVYDEPPTAIDRFLNY